jgi:hypothetical protein
MPPNPASLGTGDPPDLSGGLPPPTGVGAMPTGNDSVNKKSAIDQAILALRDVTGHVPNLSTQISSMVDALKSESAPKDPGASVDSGTGPGAAASSTDPVMESGSPGSM